MRLFGVLHRLAKGQESVSCGKAIALRLLTLKSLGFFLQNKSNFKDPNYSALPGESSADHAFLWNLYALKYGAPDSNMTTINAFFELLKV